MKQDHQLLRVLAGALSTRDSGMISSLTAAGAAGSSLNAFLDPVAQKLVALGASAQPQASFMGDLAKRLA